MNPVLRNYVLPGLLMIGILVAWDFTKPRNPGHFAEIEFKPEEQPNGGVPPYNANEECFQNGRNQIRKSAMRGLDQAWSTFCDAKGRQQLVDTVSYYFGQRSQQEISYPKRNGAKRAAITSRSNGQPPTTRASNGWCRNYIGAAISIRTTSGPISRSGLRRCSRTRG